MGDHHLRTVRGLKDNCIFFCSGDREGRYLGMGGPLVQEGDRVALLSGLRFPVVIREEGEGYRFVGPAYVHGVTVEDFWPKDGEQMETITLV